MSCDPSFTSPSMATHFLPLGFSPSSSKICSRRVTWPEVWRRCSSNACRNSWLDAAFAIFGSAFTSWVSALYRSRSSSMYNSRNESCGIVISSLEMKSAKSPAESDVRVDGSLLPQSSSSFRGGTIPPMLYGQLRILINTPLTSSPNIQLGDNFVSSLINGLMTSSSWSSSAFILTYDEFGGLYDHVTPQPAVSPDRIWPKDLLPAGICSVTSVPTCDFTYTG